MATDYKLFSLTSNLPLAEKISDYLNIPLSQVDIEHFADGEIALKIDETVRNEKVFVIQSLNAPVNDNFMMLLMMIDALRRSSASEINVVIPYFAYSRADRMYTAREPISAKLVASLLTQAGVNRIIGLDLHAAQIQGFVDVPLDHMQALPVLSHYFYQKHLIGDEVVVIAPDHSGVGRAETLARILNSTFGVIDKRLDDKQPDVPYDVIADVADRRVVIIDDLIDTGKSVRLATQAVKNAGASEIIFVATHAVCSKDAWQSLQESPIDQLIITDSVAAAHHQTSFELTVISVAELLAQAIDHIANNESIEALLQSPDNPKERI